MRRNARRDRRTEVNYGTTPGDVQEALAHLVEHDVPGTPRVKHLRTLEAAGISPVLELHDRVIRSWSITSGKPRHGEMRSDDHVSEYTVEYYDDSPCPECESTNTKYEYSAYHNISGSMKVSCGLCGEVFEEDEWS